MILGAAVTFKSSNFEKLYNVTSKDNSYAGKYLAYQVCVCVCVCVCFFFFFFFFFFFLFLSC